MMTRFPILAFVLVSFAGCADSDQAAGFSGDAELAFVRTAEQRESEFLAYEHTIVVDTSEDKLTESFQAVAEACAADRENQCTVLDSDISHGGFSRASIRMRVKPEGVGALAALAAGSGDVIRRSTHVEDLAKTIADIDKRVAILATTRDRLLELEERGTENVESLIKITTELTKVQAELEQLLGQSAHQRQRVDMDILSIQFVVEAGRSFWRPILDSLSSFVQNLSEGLADTIYAIAYLLPWSILIFFVGYLVRKLWKRSRST